MKEELIKFLANTIAIVFVLIISLIILLVFIINSNIIKPYSIMKNNVGRQIVIQKDTFTIIDFNLSKKMYILNDSTEVIKDTCEKYILNTQ